jgi:hypothetical protein
MEYDSMIHLVNTPEFQSRMDCGHPNQKGYEKIAKKMYKIMVDNKWIL